MANDYTSAERRADVKKQLRDRKGRWIEMGLHVRFNLNGALFGGTVEDIDVDGDLVTVKTNDGKTHSLGSKDLEGIDAKATLPAETEAEPGPTAQEPAPAEAPSESSVPDEDSVSRYVRESRFWDINGKLRDAEYENYPQIDDDIENLSALVDDSVLDEPLTVYRGVGPSFSATGVEAFVASIVPGATIQDNGFVSTSSDRVVAQEVFTSGTGDSVLFEIDLQQGDKAFSVDDFFNEESEEKEMILPPGQTWYVSEVTQDAEFPNLKLAKLVAEDRHPDTQTPDEFSSERTRPVADHTSDTSPEEQKDALTYYTLFKYAEMNGALRDYNGKSDLYYANEEENLRTRVDALEDLTRSYELSEPATLYRAVSPFGPRGQGFADSLVPGAVVTDHGFVSTSFSRAVAEDFLETEGTGAPILIELELPEGTRGAEVAPVRKSMAGESKLDVEEEFILPNGTNFEVTERVLDGDHYVVKMRPTSEAPEPQPEEVPEEEPLLPDVPEEVVEPDLDDYETPDEKTLALLDAWKSLSRYVLTTEHEDINGKLRDPEFPSTETVDEDIKNLDLLIDNESLAEDATVYRGVGADWMSPEAQEFIDSVVPEAVITDLGFLSTSRDDTVADTFADYDGDALLFQIQLKKGDKALDVRNFLSSGEDEILLPRGLSWRVLDVRENSEDPDGPKMVRLERVEETEDGRDREDTGDRDDRGGAEEAPQGPPDLDSGTGDSDASEARGDGDDGRADPRSLTDEELDDRILDLQLEEDVLREENGDKDEIRRVQRERLALQQEKSDREKNEDADDEPSSEETDTSEGSDRDRDRGSGLPSPDAPGAGDGDDESSREAPSPGAPGTGDDESAAEAPSNEDDESSRERPSGLPPMPGTGDGDDEHSTPGTPNVGLPNLPNRRDSALGTPDERPSRESIDITDIDALVDGDTVLLEDTVNGPEDVTEFLREEGLWTGSNDFEDLELDSEALKDYVENRDPSDLLVERASGRTDTSEPERSVPPVGDRVAFTLAGADGTGRVVEVDEEAGTAKISVAEGTIEVPLSALGAPTGEPDELEDGPSDVYAPPATPYSQYLPENAEGALSAEEQAVYREARSRLAVLQGRSDQLVAAADEVADLEDVISALHPRAVEEFSADLPAPVFAGEDYPQAAENEYVSAPTDGSTSLAADAADLYGPTPEDVSSLNADLRAGYADSQALALQDLILRSELTENTSLFRSENVSIEVAEQIQPGGVLRNESFMTTVKTPETAEQAEETGDRPAGSSTSAESAGVTDTGLANDLGKIGVAFRIEADAGSPAVDLSSVANHEQQVVLPAGVELEVLSVGWDDELGQLSVVASYDGTSVASVADLTALEENPLKSSDTTLEDLQNALKQTNEEVNKHLFTTAVTRAQGEDPSEEDVRKLAKARAVRDSVAALIATRPADEGYSVGDDEGEGSESRRPVALDSEADTAVTRVAASSEASDLAQTVTGDYEAAQVIREALLAPTEVSGAYVFVARDADGNVTGAASAVDSERVEGTDSGSTDGAGDGYVWIGHIAGQDDVAAGVLLTAVLEDAESRGRGVLLEPTPGSEDYWTQEQGFVPDPYGLGMSANGLTVAQVRQRLAEGQTSDVPVPTHSGGLDATGADTPVATAPVDSELVTSVEALTRLPAGAEVILTGRGTESETFKKDADRVWVSSRAGDDDLGLTDTELFAETADGSSAITVASSSADGREVTDRDGIPLSTGDFVSAVDGETSGIVRGVEESENRILIEGPEGLDWYFGYDYLAAPNPLPSPTPNPQPNPLPRDGEGLGEGRAEDLRDRDQNGIPFSSDGSGLPLYEGSEVFYEDGESFFGKITSLEDDGVYVRVLAEDGTDRRLKSEDLDLTVSVEVGIEE